MKTAEPGFLRDSGEAVSLVENILESSTEYSMIATDLSGRILLWNRGAQLIYGYKTREVLGKPMSMLHIPEDAERGLADEMLPVALAEGKWEGDIERRRKDGSTFPARVVLTPRRDANGHASGFLIISKDITEEKRLADELQATQAYARSMIDSNVDALIVTDPDGVITDVNEQMGKLTGLPRGELIGNPLKNCFTEPGRAEGGIRTALEQGKVTDLELAAKAPDGEQTVVSFNAAKVVDDQGRLRGVCASVRDITERFLFEERLLEKNTELERADAAKYRFLISMSHELRTPLSAIIGFTGMLRMGLSGDLNEEQRDRLAAIESNGMHLLSVIDDLLDLAKIESGSVGAHPEPIDAGELLTDVVEVIRSLADRKGIDVVVESDGTPECFCDRRSLRRILINLAKNAVKFTDSGSVVLRVRRVEGTQLVRFDVVDTGIGIADRDRSKLFAAFKQAEMSATRRYDGTGLGLYISRKLADSIGAVLDFESEVGAGSTFSLTVPGAS